MIEKTNKQTKTANKQTHVPLARWHFYALGERERGWGGASSLAVVGCRICQVINCRQPVS